jgi:hypothetical protein
MGHVQAQMNRLADPRDRHALQTIAQTFLTTEIGARFDPSGTMEFDVQIRPVGTMPMRDSTTGTWRVIEATGNALVIETVETLPQGGTQTSQVRYELSADGRTAVMAAPTSQMLATCEPAFVFERVETVSSSADAMDRR